MQVVRNTVIGLVVFWFALLFFMPKQELYYTLEESLQKEGIEINEESLEESAFGLSAINVTLYFKGIKVATVEEMDIYTLFFYSRAKVKSLQVDESLRSFVPQNIRKIRFKYSLLSPFNVFIRAEGTFGLAEGTLNIKTRKVHIDFVEPKEIKSIQSLLKKGDKGWYYETSF